MSTSTNGFLGGPVLVTREVDTTLTRTLSLAEGKGGPFDPLAPGGGEKQGEGALDAIYPFVNSR